jgi:hypothetical protein
MCKLLRAAIPPKILHRVNIRGTGGAKKEGRMNPAFPWKCGRSLCVPYSDMKLAWEHACVSVPSTGIFVVSAHGARVIVSKTQLLKMFAHLKCYDRGRPGISFINRWLRDPSIPTVSGIAFLPDEIKNNTLDLWTGFAPPPPHRVPLHEVEETIRTYIESFAILCGHDVATKERMLDWLAHMVQHPKVKPRTALILGSTHGKTKDMSILTDFMTACMLGIMVGNTSFAEVNLPAESVTGSSADDREGKCLIVLCTKELTSRDLSRTDNIITENKFIVKKKGAAAYPLECRARIIVRCDTLAPCAAERIKRDDGVQYITAMAQPDWTWTNELQIEHRLSDEGTYEFYKYLMTRTISASV